MEMLPTSPLASDVGQVAEVLVILGVNAFAVANTLEVPDEFDGLASAVHSS